ncbi:MAG: hypothetical protein RR922_05710 [Clostridia bacterium]
MNKRTIDELCIFVSKSNIILAKCSIDELADVMRYLIENTETSAKLRYSPRVSDEDSAKIKKHFKKIKQEFNQEDLYNGCISGYYVLQWK